MTISAEQKRQNRIDRAEQMLRCYRYVKQVNIVAAVFQKLRKLQSADADGNCTCVCCGTVHPWDSLKMNAGHFHSRKHHNTVFDAMNVHPSCAFCNRHLAGNLMGYVIWLRNKFTESAIEELKLRSSRPKRWTTRELAEKKIEFSDALRHLKKNRAEGLR